MLKDEFMKIKWRGNTKNHYIDKGYIFTKIDDVFEIKITDLPNTSLFKVIVICDICGKEKIIQYKNYYKNINEYGFYSCSILCAQTKRKETCLKIYGFEYPSQSEIVQQKIIKTNNERFGVDYPIQNAKIKEKQGDTMFDLYGVRNALQNENIENKRKETCFERFGVEYIGESKLIQDKIKTTNLINLGVEYPFQSKEIQDKVKETFFEKLGVSNPTQNDEIREKQIKTTIERYGESFFRLVPNYNTDSISILDEISEIINYNIQHALNGGEKKFGRYLVDGYIEELNVAIEWDEKYHLKENQKENDLIRQKFIEDNYNCIFIRISEKKWNNNKQEQIDNILNIIKNIKKSVF
jgi:hypothetical protein